MGLSGEKIRVIARGAFLHDIGKMAIPDAILRKPGALTEAETKSCASTASAGIKCSRKSRSCLKPLKSCTRIRSVLTGPVIPAV